MYTKLTGRTGSCIQSTKASLYSCAPAITRLYMGTTECLLCAVRSRTPPTGGDGQVRRQEFSSERVRGLRDPHHKPCHPRCAADRIPDRAAPAGSVPLPRTKTPRAGPPRPARLPFYGPFAPQGECKRTPRPCDRLAGEGTVRPCRQPPARPGPRGTFHALHRGGAGAAAAGPGRRGP